MPAIARRPRAARISFAFLLAAAAHAGAEARLPQGFEESSAADGLDRPTAMAFAPDGRLFICEQGGTLRVVREGVLLPTPVLKLEVDSSGERGLLGIALDPAFKANGHLYVYYTATAPEAHDRVSRFTAQGDASVAGSETILLDLPDPPKGVMHNAGALRFAADGKLMIAVGDHGSPDSAQSLESLFGKILRMNTDGSAPRDNPFFASTRGLRRLIWAYGLRNPAGLDVDPATGRIFINDVGGKLWEEINEGAAGANYGWPQTEGPATPPLQGPLHAYAWHENDTKACSIVGAAFYNPPIPSFPAEYHGRYFFADLCANWIDSLDLRSGVRARFAADTAATPVDLEVGPDGALYYLTYKGALRRIRFHDERVSR